MKLKSRVSLIIFLLTIVSNLHADDGMWMPHQMNDLNLKAHGLLMNPNDLFKQDSTGLMSAVVSLGGGTGEFVSKQGLILTNHHVAFGAIQRASDPEHDYIEDGFIARTKTEEIPAPGYIADVLLGYEEVTEQVVSAIQAGMTFLEKHDALEKQIKQIEVEAEKQGQDIRCNVENMYSGNKYYLFKFKRLQDIRLVFAPPQDLGNFGGDIDNWMWPCHTCDFSFLRAYVSRDNIGVPYAEDNVPYQPKSILKISLAGVKEGDFTFVMGYPGRTYRNYTAAQVADEMERMKKGIEQRKEIIEFLKNAGTDNKAVEIKYASRVKGLNNGLKNYQGKLEGMQKVGLVEKKRIDEKTFLEWVNRDAKRQQKYGNILQQMDGFGKKATAFYSKNENLSRLISSYYGSTLLSQANTISRAVEEREKPDLERESPYQDRNWDRLKLRMNLVERGYDFETDRAFFKNRLEKLLDVPANEIPAALKDLMAQKSADKIDQFVDELYAKTVLADPEKRKQFIEMNPDELKNQNDSLLKLAAELETEMKVMRTEADALNQEGIDLKKIYLAAILEKTGGKIAPDANGSIRFTYGDVAGYVPRDAVYYEPLTTLKGVIEKDSGEFPFHVPDKLKQLYEQKDFGRFVDPALKQVPTCFLNTTNVTGGNSGSPTLNAKGEQVGIIFDMTYESVIGDYYIIPELQRTISVDVRYIFFITEKFSNAGFILKEIGL